MSDNRSKKMTRISKKLICTIIPLMALAIIIMMSVNYFTTKNTIIESAEQALHKETDANVNTIEIFVESTLSSLNRVYDTMKTVSFPSEEEKLNYLATTCKMQPEIPMGVYIGDNTNYWLDPSGWQPPEDYQVSIDLFVLSKQLLKKLVRECIARNHYHMDRDLVLGTWQKGELSINVYDFPGLVMFNDSVEEYFSNSLSLLDEKTRHDLFYYNHPVYTKVRDRVPSYYGEDANLDNCIVADGCMLEGQVTDSVLFRNVTVAPGAKIDNCVIMNDTVVGEDAQLKYVILDKDVVVRPGARLMGTPSNPIIIKRGEIV